MQSTPQHGLASSNLYAVNEQEDTRSSAHRTHSPIRFLFRCYRDCCRVLGSL